MAETDKTKSILAERLAWIRGEKGRDLQDVAKETGITAASLTSYENGSAVPGLAKLVVLADLYDTTCDYLLGRTRQIDKSPKFYLKFSEVPEDQATYRDVEAANRYLIHGAPIMGFVIYGDVANRYQIPVYRKSDTKPKKAQEGGAVTCQSN